MEKNLRRLLEGSKRRVLWTGAGFSVHAGLPHMAGVIEAVEETGTTTAASADAWVRELPSDQLQALRIGAYYARHSAGTDLQPNLEWVVSQLDMVCATGFGHTKLAVPGREFIPASRSRFSAQDVFSGIDDALNSVFGQDAPIREGARDYYRRFMATARLASVVTTNYDKVAETALELAGCSQVPVLKLHGTARDTEGHGIMLPTWKRNPSESLTGIWRQAITELTRSDAWIVVGSSFPASDQHLCQLLALAASGVLGNEPPSIVAVNPGEENLNRFAGLIPAPANGRIKRVPAGFEDLELDD